MPLNLFRLTSDGCSEFGINSEAAHTILVTYRAVEPRMLRRAYAIIENRQSIRCSNTEIMNIQSGTKSNSTMSEIP